MINGIELSELLNAKLCHDISGPIGAINNGLDFFNDENIQTKNKAIDLVQFSSKQAINRISFYRQAYGFAAPHSEFNIKNLTDLINQYAEGGNVKISFKDPTQDSPLSGKEAKLLLNLLIILSAVIMYTGSIGISINKSSEGNAKIELVGVVPVYKLDPDLLNILKGSFENIEMTTRNVQHFYTALLIQSGGYQLDVVPGQGMVIFTLTRK